MCIRDSLCDDFKLGVQRRQGIAPNPDVEGGWLLQPLAGIRAPVTQLIRAKRRVGRRRARRAGENKQVVLKIAALRIGCLLYTSRCV